MASPWRRAFATLLLVSYLLSAVGHAQTDPPHGNLRIVILSDFNGPYGATDYSLTLKRAIHAITEVWQPDLLLSAGDVVAGQNADLPTTRFAEMWAAFDQYVARPLRQAGIPYAFAIGNHDGSSLRRADGRYTFQRERDAAHAYWSDPMYHANLAYHDRRDFPFNYSFLADKVFVLVWDASSPTITEAQLEWLTGELSSPAARQAALRLVVGHLPLYGVAADKNRTGEVLHNGDALREVLERHDVHTYISGHHAAYYPARKGELLLLHSGGIGARRLLGSDASARSTVTVMDIWFNPQDVRYTTFDTVTYEVVEPSSLPERINGVNGTVARMDMLPDDVRTEE